MHRAALFPAALTAVLLLPGCEERAGDPWGRTPDPMLAPVSEGPTVEALFARDLVVVGLREVGYACGDDCTGDGFDALYLGPETGPDQPGLATYACPEVRGPSRQWKCRALPTPYEPNGGFAPAAR